MAWILAVCPFRQFIQGLMMRAYKTKSLVRSGYMQLPIRIGKYGPVDSSTGFVSHFERPLFFAEGIFHSLIV